MKTLIKIFTPILVIIALSLGGFSLNAKASGCEVNGCGSNGSSLSGSQAQTDYNQLTQSPTLSMSGTNNNSIVNSSANISNSISVSADGGLSGGRTCAADTLSVSGSVGHTNQSLRNSSYGSDSYNGNVTLQYVHQFGEAQDRCLEGQALDLRAQKLAIGSLMVKTCLTFINSGIDVQQLALMDSTFAECPRIANQAMKGYHGRIAEKAVREYREKREANIRAMGIDPAKEHMIYMK